MLSGLSHRFVELSVQISFVQSSVVVRLFCSAVDGEVWNVRRRHSVEQELYHEDCSWVVGGGRKLAVELDPLTINHRRTAQNRTREVRRRTVRRCLYTHAHAHIAGYAMKAQKNCHENANV